MAYQLLDETTFNNFLTVENFDATTRSTLITYLESLGYFTNPDGTPKVPFEQLGGNNPSFDPRTVVDVKQTDGSVALTSDQDGDVLLLTDGTNLTVTGNADNVVIAMPDQDNFLNLQNTGSDSVYLASGDDTVVTLSGNDTVFGGGGDDLFHVDTLGSGGSQEFHGGTGNDQFWDFSSNDVTAFGDAGQDSFFLHNSGNDTVDGGANDDTIDARFSSGDNDLMGGSGNDTIYSSAADGSVGFGGAFAGHNVLSGGTGNDSLYAGVGGDTLYSGSGAGEGSALWDFSTVNAGVTGNVLDARFSSGSDSMYAHGTGDDTIYTGSDANGDLVETKFSAGDNSIVAASTGVDTIYLGGGFDTVDASAATGGTLLDTWTGDASIQLGAGDDTVNVQNGYGEDFSNSDITIKAGGGDDKIYFINRVIGDATVSQSIVNGDGTTTHHFEFSDGQNVDVTNDATTPGTIELWFQDGKVPL